MVSIFKLKEGINYNPEDPNYDLFKLACKVTAKRLFPNFAFIDAPYNLKYYKPNQPETEIAYMGCVQGSEVITYMLNDTLFVEGFERAYTRLLSTYSESQYGESRYLNTSDGSLKIYDSHSGDFVVCKKFIKNPNKNNWYRIKFNNGRCLTATSDHPLPVESKGRTFVRDLEVGDCVKRATQPACNKADSLTKNQAWFFGMLLCDSSYTNNITLSLGADETDLVEHCKVCISEYHYETTVKLQERGVKGTYYDVSIRAGQELKKFRSTLKDLFGGVAKATRSIPACIFEASRETKLAFLAGMLDADGYIHTSDGLNKNIRVYGHLGSVNKELALQQMALIEMLGLRAKVYLNKYNKNSKNYRYTINFELSSELQLYMHSAKKKANLADTSSYMLMEKLDVCKVTEIQKIDLDECSFDVETESDYFDVSGLQSHNCRTRVIGNVYDPTREIVGSRGNLSFTSINLPRLGILANGDLDKFFTDLDDIMTLVVKQLLDRLRIQSAKHVFNYPMLMGQGVWLDSEKLKPEDSIAEVLKHGTLSMGFIGLAECLTALIGKHHGESEEAQALGLRIVQYMRDRMDKEAQERKLNFTLLATPEICGHLCRNM